MEALRDNLSKRKSLDKMSELEKLHAEVKILKVKKERAGMDIFSKKTRRDREEIGLSLVRHEHIY